MPSVKQTWHSSPWKFSGRPQVFPSCSQKEQGLLQATQSSAGMKKAVWQHKGQDCVVQSNLRHMECPHWGQKGDLLKDKIKLKKGESTGKAPPIEWGINRDWGNLQSQRQDKQPELNNRWKTVIEILMCAPHTVHFWYFWCNELSFCFSDSASSMSPNWRTI